MKYTAPVIIIAIVILSVLSCDWVNPNAPNEPENNITENVLSKELGMMFTGNEDHLIALLEAQAMMSTFQDNNPNKAYAWFFSRKAIESLLAQNGCAGIRIYGGLNSEGKFSPVLFGVTTDGNDIKAEGLQKTLGDSVIIMEFAMPCPPYCGTPP